MCQKKKSVCDNATSGCQDAVPGASQNFWGIGVVTQIRVHVKKCAQWASRNILRVTETGITSLLRNGKGRNLVARARVQ